MDIDEAAVIVQGPRSPRWGEALLALGGYVERKARVAGASPSEAEDIGQQVLIKLLPKLESGDLRWNQGHRGYLADCARNEVRNLRRNPAKNAPLEQVEVPEQPPESGSHTDEDVAAALGLVDRVARAARDNRAPRYRATFERDFAQLRVLALEGAELRPTLEKDGTLPANANEATWKKARNRAYKAHQRAREELSAAVELLQRSGELTGDDADLVRRALRCFVRCQRTATSGVSIQEGAS